MNATPVLPAAGGQGEWSSQEEATGWRGEGFLVSSTESVFSIKFSTPLSDALAFFLITDCSRNHVRESEYAERSS